MELARCIHFLAMAARARYLEFLLLLTIGVLQIDALLSLRFSWHGEGSTQPLSEPVLTKA